MKIIRLTLHNFGVYAGTNTFTFNGEKPVVLIGGLNGRGKTTFLEAVLLSLYGSNSFAYKESTYKTYGQYLKSYVNENDNTQACYVELEFQMTDNKCDIYTIRREWSSANKRTHEHIFVKRNGKDDTFLTSNWAMFIENILPSALSSFFFFDGEKIAELAVDSTSTGLRESIRSMLGLAILDQLEKDLHRNIRRIGKQTVSKKEEKELDYLNKKKEECEKRVHDLSDRILKTSSSLDEIRHKLESLNQEYIMQGGDIIEQRQDLFQQRLMVIAKLNQNKEGLISSAATELPFALVKDLISGIEKRGNQEHDATIAIKAANKFQKLMEQYSDTHEKNPLITDFANYILDNLMPEQLDSVYELSEQTMLQISELNSRRIKDSIDKTKALISEKEALTHKIEELDSYLSVDINENILNRIYKNIKTVEQKQIDYEVLLKDLYQKKGTADWELTKATSEYSKYAESILSKLEAQDDAERIMKYSKMSIRILEEYNIRLQEEKTQTLADTITICYHKLANKQNLIDKINMDPVTLNMYYIDYAGKEVAKESLSAGEKQLMVIAILWALALCSKKKLPVIIDTPLSRLDSEHRKSMIKTYFPAASDQTIILSTDSEIDFNYYQMMKEDIGDEYTLNYDDATRSTSILKGYFAGDQI